MSESSQEQRALNRMRCSIAVSSRSNSPSLGKITDLSLDGMFIACQTPLREGAVLPLRFALGEQAGTISAQAEIVRVTAQGMGLKFTSLSTPDSRKLRRFVVELLNAQGSRESAQRLLDVASAKIRPIDDAKKIAELFSASAGDLPVSVFSAKDVLREQAHIKKLVGDVLWIEGAGVTEFSQGEEILCVMVKEFVSYSFRSDVLSCEGSSLAVRLPSFVQYSERRSRQRQAPQGGAMVSFAVPWATETHPSWKVLERSETGLSFAAPADAGTFWPGTSLENVTISSTGQTEIIPTASVRNVSPMSSSGGAVFRVGLAFGSFAAGSTAVTVADFPPSSASWVRQGPLAWAGRLYDKASYLFHRKAARQHRSKDEGFSVVHFSSRQGQPLVGLVNKTFSSPTPVRAPLVIVAPGFGGRKETMSGLANVIVEGFRRNYRDVAVLRYDGSNNLGESYKDPGCEGEGKNNLHFTMTSAVSDFLGSLDWARKNKIIEATDIVVVSQSIGAISVRRGLTSRDAALVSHWVSMMGAPDVASAIMRGSGNIDIMGNYSRGIPTGIIAVTGCMIDADFFAKDADQFEVWSLEDARRDMASVQAHVTWIIGKHDAYMDPEKVRNIMGIAASGGREVIEVATGHLPQSSDEAVALFRLIARKISRVAYRSDLDIRPPSQGFLAAASQREWQRVRSGPLADAKNWWKDYLVGGGGLGFDAWSFTPEYSQLMRDQLNLVPAKAQTVLDLGAGTGNISKLLAARAIPNINAMDLVPEALQRLREKLRGYPVSTTAGSIDGSSRQAVQRWLRGEINGLAGLIPRLPGAMQGALGRAQEFMSPTMYAALRGAELDLKFLTRDLSLEKTDRQALEDLQSCARSCRDGAASTADDAMTPNVEEIMRSSAGLPFAAETFDVVVCSIVLSYLEHPEDTLAEVLRVLKPGGSLVASTMLPDMDSSKAFVSAIDRVEAMPENELPPGSKREDILRDLRNFATHSGQLLKLEEEGAFHFWNAQAFRRLVAEAGFKQVESVNSCGEPALAVIVHGVKNPVTAE